MPADSDPALSLVARGPLRGTIRVPGDKSISHRALMLSALAVGESRISGLLESEDTACTAAAMRAMGATIERLSPGNWRVHGVGVGGLLQPANALQMGNSGTTTRLLAGLVASQPLVVTFVGDASLSRRPMQRITAPLSACGAEFQTAPGGCLPMRVRGTDRPFPIGYRLPVASAQVKTAILLAGLNIQAQTVIDEPQPSRDHSERMLQAMGASITTEPLAGGGQRIILHGRAELHPQQLAIPGDISSAAFPLVAALLVPGSDVRLQGVGINPTRDGLLRVLRLMGADIEQSAARLVGGEPVADLRVRHSPLRGITVPPELAPLMIDEYPVLFVAAALARGRTVMRGIGELRVKESDRIALMAAGLAAAGVAVQELPDGLIVDGAGGDVIAGGVEVATRLDHRIAMSMAVLSLCTRQPVRLDDRAPIATSFPDFLPLMQQLGAVEA